MTGEEVLEELLTAVLAASTEVLDGLALRDFAQELNICVTLTPEGARFFGQDTLEIKGYFGLQGTDRGHTR